jgi:SAM-dependent methyltransferase
MADSHLNFRDLPPRELTPEDLHFLHQWTAQSMDDSQLREHILRIHREVLASVHVYRCISTFSYLTPRASKEPVYQEVIAEAKSAGLSYRILDIGTCFGQETRGLIAAGVPPEAIVATDLHDYYWQMGKRLFDEPSPRYSVEKVTTVFGDLASPPSSCDDVFSPFTDTFDCVMCLAILHVLAKEQSECLLSRVWRMLKEGKILFGYAVGAVRAQEWGLIPNVASGRRRWLFDAATLTQTLKTCGFREVNVEEHTMPGSSEIDPVEKVYLRFVARK